MKFVQLNILLTFLMLSSHHFFATHPLPLRVSSLCINWPPTVSFLFLLWRYLLWSMFSVGQKLSHWLTLADFHCRTKSKKSLFIIKGTTYLSFLLFSHWTASVWQSTFSKHNYCYNVVQYRIVITTALYHNCTALPFAVQCTGALKLILLRRPTGRIPWISDDWERDKNTHIGIQSE